MDDRHVDTPFGLGQRWTVPHTPAWRRILWIIAGLLLVLAIVWVATHLMSSTVRTGRIGGNGPVPVGVSKVASGDIRVTVDGLGAVTPLATVTVHPQVTGYLNRFDITEGQMVKAGQLLAEIDPRPFQAALDQAKGQLAKDQATLTNAKIDLGRYEALWKQNAVSQQTLQTQIATVGTAHGHGQSRPGYRRKLRPSTLALPASSRRSPGASGFAKSTPAISLSPEPPRRSSW